MKEKNHVTTPLDIRLSMLLLQYALLCFNLYTYYIFVYIEILLVFIIPRYLDILFQGSNYYMYIDGIMKKSIIVRK